MTKTRLLILPLERCNDLAANREVQVRQFLFVQKRTITTIIHFNSRDTKKNKNETQRGNRNYSLWFISNWLKTGWGGRIGDVERGRGRGGSIDVELISIESSLETEDRASLVSAFVYVLYLWDLIVKTRQPFCCGMAICTWCGCVEGTGAGGGTVGCCCCRCCCSRCRCRRRSSSRRRRRRWLNCWLRRPVVQHDTRSDSFRWTNLRDT